MLERVDDFPATVLAKRSRWNRASGDGNTYAIAAWTGKLVWFLHLRSPCLTWFGADVPCLAFWLIGLALLIDIEVVGKLHCELAHAVWCAVAVAFLYHGRCAERSSVG